MSLALLRRSGTPVRWLRQFFWAHPEWWTLVLVALAWATVVSHVSGHQEYMHHTMPALDMKPVQGIIPLQDIVSFPAELLNWGLMVVAMMVPLMLGPLRWVAFQSFRHRRHRAILLFLIGLLLPWMLIGVVAAWLQTFGGSPNLLLASGMFGLAALWALVPVRRHALVLCHRTIPLAPAGWKADRDCLRFSLLLGASCVATCGFLMLACAFTGHNLMAMLGGIALGGLEYRSFRPPTGSIFAGALLLAVLFLLPIHSGLLP